MSLLITSATIIDPASDSPIEGKSIWIEGGRIKAIAGRDELGVRPGTQIFDARGKYLIPGLMNANVHLLGDVRLENLARHIERFEDLIAEAAQVALKNGLTTVFDTWGPRRHLINVRDQINAGQRPGCRIFCAGNIVGMDGPYSADFHHKVESVGSLGFLNRINATWVENVGRHLMWLTPEQVETEVSAYIARGIDFLKYASNDHYPGPFLVFSPRTQTAIVEAAHRAGITAQAHSMSVEGLQIALEAGCDLIQHANNSGPIPIPEATLELFARRQAGAVVFAYTRKLLDRLMTSDGSKPAAAWQVTDVNARNFIRRGIPMLLGTDGAIFTPATLSDPLFAKILTPEIVAEGMLFDLAVGHFCWFKAMEEKGCPPMQMLRGATRNIARAYGRERDLGTLEPGKIADIVVLDKNPLQSVDHYRAIHAIFKDGRLVDRSALPLAPILTAPAQPPTEEESVYVPSFGGSKFPPCPACTEH